MCFNWNILTEISQKNLILNNIKFISEVTKKVSHSPYLSFLLIVYNILFFICLCVYSKYMNMYAYTVRAVSMHVWGPGFKSGVFLDCSLPYFLRQGCSPNLEFTYSSSSACLFPSVLVSQTCIPMPTFNTYANPVALSDLPRREMTFPTFL